MGREAGTGEMWLALGRGQGSGAGTMGMVVAVPAAAGVYTCQAERRLQMLDRKELQAQRRLRELAQRITTLQERSRDARHMAQQAKDGAQRATTTSGTLSQVSSIPAWLCMAPSRYWVLQMLGLTTPLCCQDLAQVTQRYVMLKNRVGTLDRVSGGALQRVSQLMAEAQDLLDKASNSKRKLEGEKEHTVGGIFPATSPYISLCLPGPIPPAVPMVIQDMVGGCTVTMLLIPQTWSSALGPMNGQWRQR